MAGELNRPAGALSTGTVSKNGLSSGLGIGAAGMGTGIGTGVDVGAGAGTGMGTAIGAGVGSAIDAFWQPQCAGGWSLGLCTVPSTVYGRMVTAPIRVMGHP